MELNKKSIGKYVERTTKVSLVNPTGMSLKDNVYTLTNGEIVVGYDVGTQRLYRGFLKFRIPIISGIAEIIDAYLFLQSKIRMKSNFSGRFRVRYLDYSHIYFSASQASWNILESGVDWGITSVFAVEGEGHSLYGKGLNAVIKERLGKELYFSLIHESERSKIINFDDIASFLYIKYKIYISLDGAPKATITSVTNNSCSLKFDNTIPERTCEVCDQNNNVLAKGPYSCTINGLEEDSVYAFRVRYEGGVEYSTVNVTTRPLSIKPPTNIVAEPMNNGCFISWTKPGVKHWTLSYKVETYNGSILLNTLDNIESESCKIHNLEENKTYRFVIKAKCEGIESVGVTINCLIPNKPLPPTEFKAAQVWNEHYLLSWVYSTEKADGFIISIRSATTVDYEVDRTKRTFDIGTTVAGLVYICSVKAKYKKQISDTVSLGFVGGLAAPTDFRCWSVPDGTKNKIVLYWSYSSLSAKEFEVVQDGTKTFIVEAKERSLYVGILSDGSHTFKIRAKGDNSYSGYVQASVSIPCI